jgi:pimeloyl-ACP methyl ester carboxylesterase
MRKAIAIFAAILALSLTAQLSLAGEDVNVVSSGDTLYGTLELPKGSAPCPVALILPGSGPTDREGNNPMAGASNSLLYLAEALAARGIASLRFDKRGIGQSAPAATAETDLRFETYIEDAVLWGKKLREYKRFDKLIIVGHSEGSLIGMVACRELGADGFVSIAGAGHPAGKLLLGLLKPQLSNDLFEQSVAILGQLERGKTVDSTPPQLDILFRKSVQPYLISWLRYDPAEELAKLEVPKLIVQGTTDIQISMDNAERLANSAPDAEFVVIDGMNHILKEVPMETQAQFRSYKNPDLPVAPKLIDSIADFITRIDQ